MTIKRVYAVFAAFALVANLLMIRLFFIVTNESYAAAATAQSVYTKTVAVRRPDFFDRFGHPLTGTSSRSIAAVFPGQQAGNLLSDYIFRDDREYYREALIKNEPFIVELVKPLPAEIPIMVIETPRRYSDDALASHLIGYLDYKGSGISGLELALNGHLLENESRTVLRVGVNANREIINADSAEVFDEGTANAEITLTIDKGLQAAAERIADDCFKKGAIVVLDCESGEIRAVVSRPNFNQNDISTAIERGDTSLINRAFTPYSLGSVYKPVIAAAAIEAGLGGFRYECTGAIELEEGVYSCNEAKAHGELDMNDALTYSCNTYFIALGQKLGGEAVYNMSSSLGFKGKAALCEGYNVAMGQLPEKEALSKGGGELINHCFGQGRLLASPLQVAAYMNCIAAGGLYTKPTVVQSIGEIECEAPKRSRVMSEETATLLSNYLCSVTEKGTGSYGKPEYLSASGKTGTAQTGRYNSDGSEAVVGWFCGFFPSEAPRYTIAVMVENEGYGYETAAPVFKQLADFITVREKLEFP